MAKTLDQGFDAFLLKLVPLESEHQKSVSHKSTVKSCLENNFECYNFFETGSFGNGTGIRHHSDTDYFAACPTKNIWNSSSYTLTKVKEALQFTFSRTTGITVRCPAVKIPFGTFASEDLEITPCCYVGNQTTPLGEFATYEIPDCNDGWMLSSPGAHNKYVRHHDQRLNYKLKKLIQLVKAWKYYNNVPIKSFYLELRVTKHLEGDTFIDYLPDIRNFFNFLIEKELPKIQDPMGISGYIPPCNSDSNRTEALSKLNTALTRIDNAIYYKDRDLDKTFHYLDLLFGGNFPAR